MCVFKVLYYIKLTIWSEGNLLLKTNNFRLSHRHILLAFLVWFHGTLDRLKSSLVKKWYNNIVARDESPLISRSLSNPLFNCTVQELRASWAQPIWGPSPDITLMQCDRWMGENAPEKTFKKQQQKQKFDSSYIIRWAVISRIGKKVASCQEVLLTRQ